MPNVSLKASVIVGPVHWDVVLSAFDNATEIFSTKQFPTNKKITQTRVNNIKCRDGMPKRMQTR